MRNNTNAHSSATWKQIFEAGQHANDDVALGFARDEVFHAWFYAELAKFDRGEPALVVRRKLEPLTHKPTLVELFSRAPFELQLPSAYQPDREQLVLFIRTLFRHATPGTWVSLRAFPDKGNKDDKPFRITPHQLNGDFNALISKAWGDALVAANATDKIVFCPPIATFDKRWYAREEDLAEGLAISVECDKHAEEGRTTLEQLLGPATIVVESGGEWSNPETGVIERRLHVHYRLQVPARGVEQLAKLRLARNFATAIVGGDTSNETAVHPIRWPGSWHRKQQPKLCRIVSINAEAEIDLDAALAILKQAAPIDCDTATMASNDDDYNPAQKQADPDLIYAAMAIIPNEGCQNGNEDECNEWNNWGLAIFNATNGAHRGLEAFIMYSSKSPKFSEADSVGRWEHYFRHPPRKGPNGIGAGTIIAAANVAQPGWRKAYDQAIWDRLKPEPEPKTGKQQAREANKTVDAWEGIEPIDLWARGKAPPLPRGVLPKVIEDLAFEHGKLMGVDPAGLAMGALTICSAAIPDCVRLQVKKHDNWTEACRLWSALVGLPSTKKSPICKKLMEVANRIEMKLFRDYRNAQAEYEALSKEDRGTTEPASRLRFQLGDATPEAAQGAFKDNHDGLLVFHDELNAWIAAMDKYGGKKGSGYDRAFWLRSYNGGEYLYDRVSRDSSIISNLSASVFGSIHPSTMRGIVAEGSDDGLIARIIMIMLQTAMVGDDEPTSPSLEAYETMVEDLHDMTRERTAYMFTDEAQAVRKEMEHKHHQLVSDFEIINNKLASHIGKYDGIFARLCLLFHVIENYQERFGGGNIPATTARRVARLMHEFLLPHAICFYIDMIGLTDSHDRVMGVAGLILAKKLDVISIREVQRGVWSLRGTDSRREIDAVFYTLHSAGWIDYRAGEKPSDPPFGIVNPKVHIRFADYAQHEIERRQRAQEGIAKAVADIRLEQEEKSNDVD
jgi:Protein of unknown function (DUF3987)/Primase C terminal 2 (PriCT-2)